MKRISLITDGSCVGNPGPGGWACILRAGSARKELFGFDPHTTNNRMELMAAIQGLIALKQPCEVELVTDSIYVRDGATVWIKAWKRRGWWKKSRPVRNVDLWLELDALLAIHQVT
ncbi:MAG TPA: ribonuclease HI, partial [Bryobacteraceae bacterium]|nr:ribonuclease HI [Bryobacteraceae bacterium]